MIIFEKRAFNAAKVVYMDIEDNYNSRKVYCDSTLRVYFIPESLPSHMGHLSFNFPSHDQAIAKMNELVQIIRSREEELLKLKAN